MSDDPPPALVERVAARFQDTGGDIRAMLRRDLRVARVLAPRTRSRQDQEAAGVRGQRGARRSARRPDAPRAAPRAGGGAALAREIGEEPLYEAQPPTGYPDRAEAWVNAGALLAG